MIFFVVGFLAIVGYFVYTDSVTKALSQWGDLVMILFPPLLGMIAAEVLSAKERSRERKVAERLRVVVAMADRFAAGIFVWTDKMKPDEQGAVQLKAKMETLVLLLEVAREKMEILNWPEK